MLGLATAL